MFFRRKRKPPPPKRESKVSVPDDFWVKCPKCESIVSNLDLTKTARVCPKCGYHFRMGAYEYAKLLFDNGIEREIGANLVSADPLSFPGYGEKMEKYRKLYGLKDSSVAGMGRIYGRRVVGFFTDFAFLGGSMGSVFGEKFYRAAHEAKVKRLPLIAVLFSGGGARMHEGIFSLMQMVKTTVGVIELEERGVPYITILGDPTMGGVMASFAALGDVIIAEPGALIGFAGPRVIKQTIGQDLPPGFQRSEFQLEHGQVDMVIDRREMKRTVARLLDMMTSGLK
ncbi:MAG: acetyl-CoA carboxylase, carboxyltransferase subunit beta [Thermotogae bacterium]|nr:acetyl-CoA carboxylase, carboxyltransferase subunit beta [Thermotogota bacterium]